MNNYNCFALLVFMASLMLNSCSETKHKTLEEREFISLAGQWSTKLGEIKLPGTIDESKLAPQNTDTLNTSQLTRLNPYEGKMRYIREIEITPSLAHKNWRLILERTKPSTVWLDGDSIGSSSIILAPQIFTLGKLTEGKHQISIEVDNGASSVPDGIKGSHAWTDATQTNWNGIIGKIGIEAYDDLLIEMINVYPDIKSTSATAKVRIYSNKNTDATLKVKGHTWNTDKELTIPTQEIELKLQEGSNTYDFGLLLGKETVLWSEFDPALYAVHFTLMDDNDSRDYFSLDFGLKDFSTNGTQFTINSLRTFLRGKHDACVFPLTGYPPMEKEEWVRQFRISKRYGINHYRFHSWTPPQAAFEAANEEGIYIQTELPYWGMMNRENKELNDFLLQEGKCILEFYGNNPSLVMMALGNELGGDVTYMREIVDTLRSIDSRPLFAFGANNLLGTGGQQEGEDFFVTCRVGGQVGSSDYSRHTRATFSFADAKDGGYMNGTYPNSSKTFAEAISHCTVPVISHENGQFQSYPNYDEIDKYTGVLYPYNLKIFRERLSENSLTSQAKEFQKATARFAAICYKEDIEMCLRTRGMGGFQVLDLQDYPGQGSAYVGVLDAFMDNKGGITADEFKGFCSEIVPLALLPKFTWSTDEVFSTHVQLFNYSAKELKEAKLTWTLVGNNEVISNGAFDVGVNQGSLSDIGKIEVDLKDIAMATQVKLQLQIGEQKNSYDLWVYPAKLSDLDISEIAEVNSLSEAIRHLKANKNVLYNITDRELNSNSVKGLFTPDYWNYAMFKNISEHLNREVSPGTLSLLTNPQHPMLRDFPTEFHSNWQWWSILKNAHPIILDNIDEQIQPIIQIIDNIERNHKLGLVFEVKVGEGKLLVNSCDLTQIQNTPEGKQFSYSIYKYMLSSNFDPKVSIIEEELRDLLNSTLNKKMISGVENITSYK